MEPAEPLVIYSISRIRHKRRGALEQQVFVEVYLEAGYASIGIDMAGHAGAQMVLEERPVPGGVYVTLMAVFRFTTPQDETGFTFTGDLVIDGVPCPLGEWVPHFDELGVRLSSLFQMHRDHDDETIKAVRK